MSYQPTRRQWIKLWVEEWLGGTTRFELDPAERSVWADLLAMAGRSKFPGIIASGHYDDGYRGYPLQYLAGILVCPDAIILNTLKKCESKGKIKLERKIHDGTEDCVIIIVNWEKYQSEYQRQVQYREKRKLQSELHPICATEGEGEGEGEKKKIRRKKYVHFEEFWKEYPRKEARVKAEQAFKSLNPSEKLLEIILDDISSRKQSEAWQKDGGKYIPLPASYLRGKRWEDETKKEAPNGKDRRYPEEKLYTDPDSLRNDVILSTDPAILKLHEDLKGEKPHPPDG